MTPEQLRELDCRILTHFFQWRWLRVVSRNLCCLVPPEPWTAGRWRPATIPADPSTYFASVDGVPPVTDRFHKWWRDAYVEMVRNGLPSPSTNPVDCAELRAELVKSHFIRIEMWPLPMTAASRGVSVVIDGVHAFERYDAHPSPVAAECLAVARAADKLIGDKS